MGREGFRKRGIRIFFLGVLLIFGLNRLIQPNNVSKIEALEKRLKREQHNPSLILSLADSYYKKAIHLSSDESISYLKGAISLYKRALKIKEKPKIAFYLGRAYFKMAKYSKEKERDKFYRSSQKHLLFSYSKGFVSRELFILIGHTYLISGNFDKAIEFYEKSLSILKKDPIVLLNLAFSYKKKEDLDKALQYLKMIDKPKGDDLFINLHLQLGDIYEKKGLLLLAKKEYLLVLKRDKKHKEAQEAIKRLK